jgi:hypothetical protein
MSQPTPPQLLDGRRATLAYADLMFAFGFARLGDATTVEHLRDDATRQLAAIETHREFHRLARLAFDCRIAEALRGDPHTGTLDDRCPEVIAALLLDDFTTPPNTPPGELAYILSQLIHRSAILEPERAVDPYYRAKVVREFAAWSPREFPSTAWDLRPEVVESPQRIWEHIRRATNNGDRGSMRLGTGHSVSGYVQGLPTVLAATARLPFGAVRRVVGVMAGGLPAVENTFTTAPRFSRNHLAVVDALVLAVVGTGPLPPEAERLERLELLRSVRPPVKRWVEAMP